MNGPVVLVVLDGFGIGDGGAADATSIAHTPFFARARADYPSAQLETSGESVGLPPGQRAPQNAFGPIWSDHSGVIVSVARHMYQAATLR